MRSNWRTYLSISDGNVLTHLAVWLILLLPLVLPVVVYKPFTFGRFIIFMFLTGLLALGAALIGKYKNTVAWWRHPVTIIGAVWLVEMFLAALAGTNFARSFWGDPSRSTGLILFLGLAVTYVALLAAVRERSRWLAIFAVMSWIGSLSAVYALMQKFGVNVIYRVGFDERVGGLLGNPIFLGQFLLLTVFLTLYLATNVFSRSSKIIYWLALLLQVIALFLTASRGPVAGLLVGLIIFTAGYGLLYWRRSQKKIWLGVLGGVGALASVLAIIFVVYRPALERLITVANTSLAARSITWGIIWDAIKARPWLGYGNDNIISAFNNFYQPGLAGFGAGETIVDRSHNFILDQWATNGILGLVLMAIFWTVAIWLLVRKLHDHQRDNQIREAALIVALLATIGAYLIANLTAFDVVTNLIYGTVLLAGAVYLMGRPVVSQRPVLLPSLKWGLGIALIAILIFDVKYLAPAWKISQRVQLAERARSAQDYAAANRYYAKAQELINPYRWPLLNRYPIFARQYALLLMDKSEMRPAAYEVIVDGLRVLQNIVTAEPDRAALLAQYPVTYTVMSYLDLQAELYQQLARKSFDDFVKAFPNHEYIYIDWARALIGQGKPDQAAEIIQRASQLPVPPRELEFWRAVVNMRIKSSNPQAIFSDLLVATQKSISFQSGDESLLRDIVNYLFKAKRFDIAVRYQEWIVKLLPQNVDELMNLAVIYKNLGRFDDAAQVARQIVVIDLGRFTVTKNFLREIGREL